jgi:glycosyltransferase involved in cell wall biosynthesis
MRIVYDARVIDQPLSGLGRFAGELLLSLLDSDIRSEVCVDVLAPAIVNGTDNPYLRRLKPHIDRGRCVVHYLETPAISVQQQWAIPRFLRTLGGDLYFYPHFDVPSASPIPFLFVVHDLIPLKVPGYVLRFEALKKTYYKSCVRRGLRKSRRCIVVSATTRTDMLHQFGGQWARKVQISYEGSFLDPATVDHTLRARLGINAQYLLYVGTRRPNKNIRFMIDMFVEMRERFGYRGELVMAGSKENFGFDVDRYAAGLDGIRMLGPVSDGELAALYAGMESLLFLSKYEGFGLPVIEAAKFGRRMILSDGGALREIAPESACIIPLKSDIASAAAAAVEYLQQTGVQVDLSTYGERFTWRAVARSIFLEAY